LNRRRKIFFTFNLCHVFNVLLLCQRFFWFSRKLSIYRFEIQRKSLSKIKNRKKTILQRRPVFRFCESIKLNSHIDLLIAHFQANNNCKIICRITFFLRIFNCNSILFTYFAHVSATSPPIDRLLQ